MTTAIYKGFSTQKWLSSNGQTLLTTNLEAVKNELLNHIFTAPGDRLSLPNWGTRIPSMAFEPNDEITRQIIYDDIKMCIDYDPRLRLIDMYLVSLPDNNAITVWVDVLYIEFNVEGTLNIDVPVGGG